MALSASFTGIIKRNASHFLSVGIPLLFIPFLHFDGLLDPVLIPKFLAFAMYLSVYGMYVLYGLVKKRKVVRSINGDSLLWLFLSYFIISGLSLFYSGNLSEGLFDVAKIGCFLIYMVLMLVRYGRSDDLKDWLAKYAIIFTAVAAIAGLAQFIGLATSGDVSHGSSYNISATFAHKNLYSQVLLLSLPFTVYGVLSLKSLWRLFGLAGAFISLFLVTVVLSRASWIAFIAGGGATILLWMMVDGARFGYGPLVKKNIKKIGVIGGALLMVASISIIVYSKLDTMETIEKQVISISDLQHSATKDRISLWKKSYQLAEEQPLLGHGVGSWRIQIQKTGTGNMRSVDGITFFQRPHNDFLLMLCETGIAGLILYTLIFFVAIKYILAIVRRVKNSLDKLFAYLLFFGLMEYVVFSLFSFPKERYEPVLLLCLLMVGIINRYVSLREAVETKVGLRKLIAYSFIGFLTVISSIWSGFQRFKSEAHVRLAFKARANSDWEQVISEINLATSPFYELDPTSTPLRWYSGSAEFNNKNLNAALLDFQKAYEIHPYQIHVLNNLASTYSLLGDTAKAMDFYDKAIAVNPAFRDAYLNKAIIYYNNGELTKSYQCLRNIHEAGNDYRQSVLLLKLLHPLINTFRESAEQHLLVRVITQIQNSNDWTLSVHYKSVREHRPFEYQLLLDAVYVLEVIDKIITFDEATTIKAHYVAKYDWAYQQ